MATTGWRKSSRSSNSGDQNCVEARAEAQQDRRSFELRDSKLGDNSPIFGLSEGDYQGFLGAVRR